MTTSDDAASLKLAYDGAVDLICELLNQGCISEPDGVIFHGCMSIYEDTMRYLIDIGKMEDLGRGRARFKT